MNLWVFGYGSLIWNPGFEVKEQAIATLRGYARSFCMHSIHHRGTVENPGLVLALDHHETAHCQGVGLSVPEGNEDAVVAYLRERELISSAYIEAMVDIELADGRGVRALTFVMDTDHVQYCGGMALENQAQIIAHAVGDRGPNTEYLYNTALHLGELGIDDPDMDWLAARVRDLVA